MQESPAEKPEEVAVKLKPVLGTEPTVYLPVLYLVVVVIVLFLVLILPGLTRPGSQITVVSSPPNSAVSVDGVIVGQSGQPIFVPAGRRTLQVSRPGHSLYTENLEVRRRLVGSLFFPRKLRLRVNLEPLEPGALVQSALLEFSEWALMGEASGQYQFPPVARDLGRDLGASGNGDGYEIFAAGALPQVNSQAQLNDLLAGALLAHSGGSVPGPLAVATLLQELGTRADEVPALPLQLASATGGMLRETIEGSSWYDRALEIRREQIESVPPVQAADLAGALQTIRSTQFVTVPGGNGVVGGEARAERGGEIPYVVTSGRLLVARTETTVGSYREFVQMNPEWSPGNRSVLVERGLVDEDYLRDWSADASAGSLPVRNVSLHAARAFAAWFASEAGLPESAVRLPSEAEWDYISALDSPDDGVFARTGREGPQTVGESGSGALGLYGIRGNLWEWTSTPFALYGRYYPGQGVAVGAAQWVVRGGGWATWSEDFTPGDRGSMPAHWCSDAVGFRLVIVE